MSDELHHHSVPSCILAKAKGRSTLVGYALDGYGIYVERNANGSLLTNTQLDACHGRTSRVLWDGKEQVIYHYDATLEYPYTIGCFHGTPITLRAGATTHVAPRGTAGLRVGVCGGSLQQAAPRPTRP
jgi:hypothetical protein